MGRRPTPNLSVTMVRADLAGLPRHAVPDGHAIRPYAPGDERTWFRIQSAADAYSVIDGRLFRDQFGDDARELGRRLAKPLLSRACLALRDLGHESAFLTTSTARVPAIALYLSFGFVPEIGRPEDAAAWQALHLSAPGLALRFDGGTA